MLRLVGGDARADEGPALVVVLLLSKEDSVRERDNIRFAIPLPAIFEAESLDGLGEKSNKPERSLAGFLGVNGPELGSSSTTAS